MRSFLGIVKQVLSGREAHARRGWNMSEPRWCAARLIKCSATMGYGTLAVETLTCGPTMAIARPGAAFTFATSENVC